MWRCFAEPSAVPHSIIYRSRGGLTLVVYMTANLKSIRKETFFLSILRAIQHTKAAGKAGCDEKVTYTGSFSGLPSSLLSF